MDQPTDEEIQRVNRWQVAERERRAQDARVERTRIRRERVAELTQRLDTVFVGKRIVSVDFLADDDGEDVWDLTLKLDDGSQVHIESEYDEQYLAIEVLGEQD